MNRLGQLKKKVRDDLCIICHYDFESHRWLTPADKEGGHDYTPIQGKPIRHPSKPPISEGHPNRNEMEAEGSGTKEGHS